MPKLVKILEYWVFSASQHFFDRLGAVNSSWVRIVRLRV